MPEAVVTETPAVAAPWYAGKAGHDESLTALWTDKKWDVADPALVAIEASRAYQSAAKLVGAPPSELVRYKPDDPQVMEGFYARQGVPKDVAGYVLEGKRADGTTIEPAQLDAIRKTALDARLTVAQAKIVAENSVKYEAAAATAAKTANDAAVAADRAKLEASWGKDNVANKLYAIEGAKTALGGDTQQAREAVGALEKVIGYAATMEMFRKIGQGLHEPGAVGGQGGVGGGLNGPTTREDALREKSTLTSDPAWAKRWYTNGKDGPEARQMQRLDAIISGQAR